MSKRESKQTNKQLLVRRKFLTKSVAAAVVVGSIPSRSVWANGITNSIVASGHGSDFAGGKDIELLRPCSLLTLLQQYESADLDKNFSRVFGEGPNKLFSEILSCHCSCPKEISYGISNVVFRIQVGSIYIRFKIDEYPGDVKNPNDPTRYISYLESTNGGTVVDYVIKAGQNYYDPTGEEVSPSSHPWYTGFNGKSNIDGEVNANDKEVYTVHNSTFSGSCEGDEVTVAMIAMYLNARFDYYFRNGMDVKFWQGEQGIYYPILKTRSDTGDLVRSIKSSKFQLVTILETYASKNELIKSC